MDACSLSAGTPRDASAMTDLHSAARYGNEAVVELLLEKGTAADEQREGSDATPLILAAAYGHDRVVRLLLKNGAHIDARDADGDSALHSAAYHGHQEVVQALLDYGANPLAKGGTGRTARSFAAERGHKAVVQLLKEYSFYDQGHYDMENDAHETLEDVAEGNLLSHIESAQRIMFPESSLQPWVQNLRFVVSHPQDEGLDYDLELIEAEPEDNNAGAEPYVAVSYCWGMETGASNDKPLRIRVPSRDQRNLKEVRDVRASSVVLRRSLGFALAKGIRRIWIDQECIHQDDEEDKQKAIQSMHLVYQNATATLILLGCHIRTLDDVYGMPDIMRHGVYDDLRDRILADKWFTRAWTTQEYASSAHRNLSYLVGYDDGVDVSGELWQQVATTYNSNDKHPRQSVCRAWELDHSQIFAISHMAMRHVKVRQSIIANSVYSKLRSSGEIYTLVDQSIDQMGWWKRSQGFDQ